MSSRPKSPKSKMTAYRERMRAAGLRPIQIWVPNVRSRSFKAKLRRQVAALDPSAEIEAMNFIEALESQE